MHEQWLFSYCLCGPRCHKITLYCTILQYYASAFHVVLEPTGVPKVSLTQMYQNNTPILFTLGEQLTILPAAFKLSWLGFGQNDKDKINSFFLSLLSLWDFIMTNTSASRSHRSIMMNMILDSWSSPEEQVLNRIYNLLSSA